MSVTGLRNLKKQQTRHTILDTALRLFAERGFDRVTVVEIARKSNVSQATVFNYFPTKEHLVFSNMETVEEQLVEAVRRRRPGESAVAAFRTCLLTSVESLTPLDADTLQANRNLAGIVAGSPG